VASLPNAYERANTELRDAEEALRLLTDAADADMISVWDLELAHAQEERAKGNIKAMDVLRGRIAKGSLIEVFPTLFFLHVLILNHSTDP
jgi:hypothetical protein